MSKKAIDDHDLFIKAMRGVRPLACNKIGMETPHPLPVPRQKILEAEQIRHDMLSDEYDAADVETGEELLFVRPGTRYGEVRKLRRGYFSVCAELDLHGMVTATAYSAVKDFLHECYAYNIRCARIVHGKGHGSWQKQPILKLKLNRWLRQHDVVLAFCSARPVDGGTGAVYVLIKNRS